MRKRFYLLSIGLLDGLKLSPCSVEPKLREIESFPQDPTQTANGGTSKGPTSPDASFSIPFKTVLSANFQKCSQAFSNFFQDSLCLS